MSDDRRRDYGERGCAETVAITAALFIAAIAWLKLRTKR